MLVQRISNMTSRRSKCSVVLRCASQGSCVAVKFIVRLGSDEGCGGYGIAMKGSGTLGEGDEVGVGMFVF